jgi:soluble lytic murein transglycosylase-like protein
MNKITLSLLFVALVALGASHRSYGTKEDLFRAMAQVESSGNPKAINAKETALGIYQIRPMYFLDAGVKGAHSQVYDPTVARKVCERYFMRYEPKAFANNDIETLARLHNAGPNWRKNKSSTDKYWNKIKKHL